MQQFTLKGANFGGVAQAIVFAIFSYVGFESAASLGKESRNPKIMIPKAILWTTIFSGSFFVITTYAITQGFGDDATKLGNSAAPLGDITNAIGKYMTAPVYFGATISSFACALASLNAFGRMLFSLGRYQFVHSSMGIVHQTRKTPYFALTVGAIINFLVCAAFAGNSETNTFGWYGTIASYGFIIVYFLCSVSAPFLLKRTGEMKPQDMVIGGLGAVLMVLSLIGSVYPVPAAPYNYFPYAFAAYMLIGFACIFLKFRTPAGSYGHSARPGIRGYPRGQVIQVSRSPYAAMAAYGSLPPLQSLYVLRTPSWYTGLGIIPLMNKKSKRRKSCLNS